MNEMALMSIPEKLRAAGFAVFFARICYEPGNPVWRANASREGREWRGMGIDLAAALLVLDELTRELGCIRESSACDLIVAVQSTSDSGTHP